MLARFRLRASSRFGVAPLELGCLVRHLFVVPCGGLGFGVVVEIQGGVDRRVPRPVPIDKCLGRILVFEIVDHGLDPRQLGLKLRSVRLGTA